MKPDEKIVVALTGAIGSGKSLAGLALAELGYSVIDCDAISRKVADMPETISAVFALMGSEFIENGALNRRKIREKIFTSPELLAAYSEIFDEKINLLLREEIAAAKTKVVFVEIPRLSAVENVFTEVWQVVMPEEKRYRRVAQRDGTNTSDAAAISAVQHFPSGAMVLYNDGTAEQFVQKVQLLASQRFPLKN